MGDEINRLKWELAEEAWRSDEVGDDLYEVQVKAIVDFLLAPERQDKVMAAMGFRKASDTSAMVSAKDAWVPTASTKRLCPNGHPSRVLTGSGKQLCQVTDCEWYIGQFRD